MTKSTETRDVRSVIRERWDNLVKPPGSLGQLEDLVVRLGGIQRTPNPEVNPARLLLFAGDHGVTEEEVSAYPASVTGTMLEVIREGGAAVNSLCESAGLELEWYNVGVNSEVQRDGESIGDGTRNAARDRAMTESELEQALAVGRDALRSAVDDGVKMVALGEIGIGNTTASSAVTAAILGCSVDSVVGPGSGVQGDQLDTKKDVVRTMIDRHRPDPEDGLDVLAAVGGYELAAHVGVILEAARRDVPVLLDGFITGASALAATRTSVDAEKVLVAGHASSEPAHRKILDELGLDPLAELDLRLGEGTGAAVVYPMIEAALAAYRGMSTFEDAGIGGENR